jgi:3-oxoadipate enol-lactonase
VATCLRWPIGWSSRPSRSAACRWEAITEQTLEGWLSPRFRGDEPDVVQEVRAELHATDDEGYAACSEAIGALDLRRNIG